MPPELPSEPYQSRRDRERKVEIKDLDITSRDRPNFTPTVAHHGMTIKKKAFLAGAGLLFLVSVVVGAYLFGQYSANQKSDTKTAIKSNKSTSEVVATETPSDPELANFITPTTGEKWYKTPKPLPTQGYVAADYVLAVKYFEVGTRGKSTIILGSMQMDIGPDTQELFEKASNGAVTHIAHPSATATYKAENDYSKGTFVSTVTEDMTTRYDSLSFPKSVVLKNGEALGNPDYPTLGQLSTSITRDDVKVSNEKTIGQSKIIRIDRVYVDTKLTAISYALQTPIGTEITLGYEAIDAALTGYTWDNGVAVDDTVKGIVRGCGATSGVSRSDTLKDSDMASIGKDSKGRVIYGFKDSNATLLQKAFEEYQSYYKDDPSSGVLLTKDEFVKKHGIIAYKTKGGEWLVYTRDLLSPAYGCAKPVVYLYPEKTQQVSVRVGADVKISDPLYSPKTGWNVIAKPNGQLTVNGASYSSLFWEGPGIGVYPAITSGVVVKRSQAVSTIKKQLTQQGLNAQESTDFLAYWSNKIPNKPYVRLTWLTNSQLNQLAPLAISPKPDTVQRVFLDMAGLDTLIKLRAQALHSFERRGFTVVEWGGLAQERLY